MLIKCPECELQVSDKAIDCPHCGYPLKPLVSAKKRVRSQRRKRLPNGFGQISEIKGRNLRKPFRVMVHVGKDSDGRPISKLLKPQAYFETYNDAYAALLEYNRNPYDFSPSITLKELYEQWSPEHHQKISKSAARVEANAWRYCSSLYNIPVRDIRARHIKGCVTNGTTITKKGEKKVTPAIQGNIKSLMNLLLDYAVEYEIIDRNYARTFSLDSDIKRKALDKRKPHISFSKDEIDVLWKNLQKVDNVDILLIQCYTGMRPQELGLIKVEDVDLNNRIMIGGMKTKAGKRRPIPIHSKIIDIVTDKYKQAKELHSEYLLNCSRGEAGLKLTYDKYKFRFYTVIKQLNLNPEHRPHDARVYFVTEAKKAGLDEYAIKYIVGHAINDITEEVYTKRNFDWLKEEIEKIK